MNSTKNKQESKKVLLLNYEFPPIGGGAATATYNMLNILSGKKEVEIELITASAGKSKIEKFAENIKIHYLDIGKNNKIHSQSNKDLLLYSWKAFWYCRKLKKESSFNLIHAFFGIPCGFIAMFLGIPYIVSLRGSDVPFYSEKYRWLDILFFSWISKIVWKRARRVIANSEGLKELALKAKSNQEIDVIYNGVDTEIFHPSGKINKGFTIISTSRLIKRKGVDLLVEAFIKFAKDKNDVKLLLAGDGSLRNNLEEIVSENGMNNEISFLGALPRKEMPDLYRKGNVFVLPSLNEGMSNSLLEAMASGLAVVATDTGGTKELINKRNGIVIQKGRQKVICEAFEKLYADSDSLLKKQEVSRNKAMKMNWQEMAENYLKNYKIYG